MLNGLKLESRVKNSIIAQIILAAVVSAVLGLITGLLTGLWAFVLQDRKPQLRSTAYESASFKGQDKTVGIYRIIMSNYGTKEAEDIVFTVKIDSANIEQNKFISIPEFNPTPERVSNDTVRVKIPNLNPLERLEVFLLASSSGELPKCPDITLRGRAVDTQLVKKECICTCINRDHSVQF